VTRKTNPTVPRCSIPEPAETPDAVLDLIDALTVAGHVESPVALSEQTPFRRKFSMVYDTLSHAVIDFDALLHTLLTFQPSRQ
jgi:hypothetical protein